MKNDGKCRNMTGDGSKTEPLKDLCPCSCMDANEPEEKLEVSGATSFCLSAAVACLSAVQERSAVASDACATRDTLVFQGFQYQRVSLQLLLVFPQWLISPQ